MLSLKLTVFIICSNAYAFQKNSILADIDPYAGILIEFYCLCIIALSCCGIKMSFEFKSKDKTNEMIFYKRSGMSSSQQALQDAQDYVEADHGPLGFSDYEFWL